MKTFSDLTDDEYKAMVVSLGCLIDGAPAEIHHIREGVGIGQRNSDRDILPLCPLHHRTGGYGIAFHAGPKAFEAIHGCERDLQAEANRRINLLLEYQ